MRLRERAIQDERDLHAMGSLGNLLPNGAEGVPYEAVRVQSQWERAVKEAGHNMPGFVILY